LSPTSDSRTNVAIAATALACDAYARRREMWDVLWERMLAKYNGKVLEVEERKSPRH
jgi:hypothetical protein